jgi:hypothetical protein
MMLPAIASTAVPSITILPVSQGFRRLRRPVPHHDHGFRMRTFQP